MPLELEIVIPPTPRIAKGSPVGFGVDPKGIFLVYNNGNSVILRNLKDPTKNYMYTQHSTSVMVAKYSPSGFYIASADKSGKVRIWDTVNSEHILKNEYQPFSGPISDLSWSADNSKIIVGGTGQSSYGAVFNVDTGTSVGVIMGMSKNVNSTAFRPTRPFRAITGDDEGLICYFEGPPFAFKHHAKNHTRFVNVVSYCPTGTCFISAGMDGKIFVYDGQTGDTLDELGKPAHAGGIYGACFSKDGSRLLSASFDKSLKLWKVDGKEITFLSQYQFANKEENIIMGCCWIDDVIVAITFDGVIHMFHAPAASTDNLSPPTQKILGHSHSITCAGYSQTHNRLFTASADGKVMSFILDNAVATRFIGEHGHKTHIKSMGLSEQFVFTVGYDDRCALSSITDHEFVSSIKLPSQPHCVGVHPTRLVSVIASDQHITMLQASSNGTLTQLDQQPLVLGTCSLTMSSKTGTTVVYNHTGQLIVYKTGSNRLEKVGILNGPSSGAAIMVGAFSSNGSVIAFALEDRSVMVYSVTSDSPNNEQLELSSSTLGYWQNHSARISSLGWSPSGRRLATGGLDTCIVVYSLDNTKSTIVHRGAHPMSNSTSISWIDDNTLTSTALDGSIRIFKVPAAK